MARMVKRLSQLEIDEVSLVDRPANQHGLVAIAKNYQEDEMPDLFEADGTPVDEDELQHGDRVYDEAGNEYLYAETAEDEGTEGDEEYVEQGELAGVGKALIPGGRGFMGQLGRHGEARVRQGGRKAKAAGIRALQSDQGQRVLSHVNSNRGRYAAGGAGAAGVGVGYGAGRVGKSFGSEVMETLSKALNDGERDVILSKAFDQVEEIAKRNEDLAAAVEYLLEDREGQDYLEVAKAYDGVPVQTDELAGVLQRAANSLPPEDLEVLDRILSGASEMSKSLFADVGVSGYGDDSIMAQIDGIAGEAVSKGGFESGLTREVAITTLFAENPDAYDAYEAETRR